MGLLAFEFFFRLLWGWNFFIFFISRAESSEAFLRISFRFSLGLVTLALVCGYLAHAPAYHYSIMAALILAARFYRWHLPGFRLLAAAVYAAVPVLVIWQRGALFGTNFLLSAGVLGGAFVGQFLGHWYLNVPNIHIREFKRVSTMALAAIALRIVWVLAIAPFVVRPESSTFAFTADGDFFALRGSTWLGLGSFGVILFVSRVLSGLVAPAILTFMAKTTVNLRATQSATGIFYANSVLVLLGEATALYLERELAWPV